MAPRAPDQGEASTQTEGLPRRPRLRPDVPVLWRDEDELQVGTGPDAVVLPGTPRALVAWVSSLDGLLPLAAAFDAAAVADLDVGLARRLLEVLHGCGALDDAAVTPAVLRLGDPDARRRLAPDLAAAAHVHGDAVAAARALDRRATATVLVSGTGRTADAVRACLEDAGVVGVARSRQTGRTPTVTVIADDQHPEVVGDEEVVASGEPHLVVAVHGRRAVVGPFVVPGVTGCLRCEDLHRRDRDGAWPRLAVQLGHRRPAVPPVDAVLARLAASMAVLQVLAYVESGGELSAWLAGAAPPTFGHALEVTLPGGRWRSVARHPHPLCGCRWQEPA